MTVTITRNSGPLTTSPGYMSGKEFSAHKSRIRKELAYAGVSRYGLLKSESRYLPRLIHKNEPIYAAIYGQTDGSSAMMVATDRRLVYLDKQPLFAKSDEITYDVVSGVSYGRVGLYTAVTVHTRIGDYVLKWVNLPCALRFVKYLEGRCLEHTLGQ